MSVNELPAGTVFYSHLNADESDLRHDISFWNSVVLKGGAGLAGALDMTAAQFARVYNAADIDFGGDNFTIEFLVEQASGEQGKYIMDKSWSSSSGFYIATWTDASGYYFLRIEIGSSTEDVNTGESFASGKHHVAFVRESDTLRVFVDGVYKNSVAVSGDYASNSSDIILGARSDGASGMAGELGEIRLSNIARYPGTDTFDVATEPFVPDANTLLLYHANGDVSDGAHDMTMIGDGSNGLKILGGGASDLAFMGACDFEGDAVDADKITAADSDDWNFGDEDLSIMGAVMFNTATANQGCFYQQYDDSDNYIAWYHNNYTLYFKAVSGGVTIADYSVAWTPIAYQWYSLLVVRYGATIEMAIDGEFKTLTETTAISTSSLPDVAAEVTWAYDSVNSVWFKGRRDELYINKGYAIWTTDYGPPKGPFLPADSVYDFLPMIPRQRSIIPSAFSPSIIPLGGTSFPFFAAEEEQVAFSSAGRDSISNETSIFDSYSPVANVWEALTDVPSPARIRHAGSTILMRLYTFGGLASGATELQDCDSYYPNGLSWANMAPLPSPARYDLTAVTILNNAYVMGGWNGGALPDNDEYNQGTNSWSGKTDVPSPTRYFHAAVAINNDGIIFGGYNYLIDNDAYSQTGNSWSAKTNVPSPGREELAAATILGKAYLFGGFASGAVYIQDNDEFNFSGNSWANKMDVPSPGRSKHSAAAFNDKGGIFGGTSNGSDYLDDNDIYNPAGNTWTNKTAMIQGIIWAAASSF